MTSALRYRSSEAPAIWRGLALVIVITAVLAGTVATGESTLRSGYPFLDAGPLRAPDILYLPTYFPSDSHPIELRVGRKGPGIELEMLVAVREGQVVVWESTGASATVEDATGPYEEEGDIKGALATWHSAHTSHDVRLLHARIGQTLVVISGPLPIDELLRIADSMRQGSSRDLII